MNFNNEQKLFSFFLIFRPTCPADWLSHFSLFLFFFDHSMNFVNPAWLDSALSLDDFDLNTILDDNHDHDDDGDSDDELSMSDSHRNYASLKGCSSGNQVKSVVEWTVTT